MNSHITTYYISAWYLQYIPLVRTHSPNSHFDCIPNNSPALLESYDSPAQYLLVSELGIIQSLLKSSILLMAVDDTHKLTREYELFFWITLICSDIYIYLMVGGIQYSKEPVLAFGGEKRKSIPGRVNFI